MSTPRPITIIGQENIIFPLNDPSLKHCLQAESEFHSNWLWYCLQNILSSHFTIVGGDPLRNLGYFHLEIVIV